MDRSDDAKARLQPVIPETPKPKALNDNSVQKSSVQKSLKGIIAGASICLCFLVILFRDIFLFVVTEKRVN